MLQSQLDTVKGEIETNNNMDGFVVTTDVAVLATVEGADNLLGSKSAPLLKGDRIDLGGNVMRDGVSMGNIAYDRD
jgi:predicted component of type VI protein secretion system